MAIYYFRSANGNWNSAASWSISDNGPANGAIPTSADDAYFTSNSGNCTVNTAGMVCKTLIFNGVGAGNYASTFSLTNTLTVSGSITLSSTMTFAGTSTITINAASTITTNTKVFTCNFTINAVSAIIITLGDDVYISGSITFASTAVTVTGNTLYIAGSFTMNAGTASIINSNLVFNGTGSITAASSGANIGGSGNITFNTTGTISFNTTWFNTTSGASRSISYVAGRVIVPVGSTLTIAATAGTVSLDLSGVIINGGLFLGCGNFPSGGIISLISDLNVEGIFQFGSTSVSGAQNLIINTAGGTLRLGKNRMCTSIIGTVANATQVTGTCPIVIGGSGFCTWSCSGILIALSITFNFLGKLNSFDSSGGVAGMRLATGTFTYLSGSFSSYNFANSIGKGTLAMFSCTLIGFNRVSGFGNISIVSASTITMDKFFCGSPQCVTSVACATSTGSYTIVFQDTFEKLANFIKLANCTVTQRGQLLVLNNKANGGRNIGVRYINTLPNGVAKHQQNQPAHFAGEPMTFGASGLVSDPAITL